MPKEADKAILETIHSGYITQGPLVDRFENAFGAYIENSGNVVALNSGTSALTLALRLAGVGIGDKVISTPMTCTATNLPIVAAGAEIIWADVDPDTGMIMGSSIKQIIKQHDGDIAAIMTCDWGGTPVDYDYLRAIADAHSIPIIEDAAHAIGATYYGQPVGSFADYTCFSFQAIKHMTTVDGGALSCLRPEDAARGRVLRWFGIDRAASGADSRIDQDIVEWGYKYHMNDVAAAIGLVQLMHVNKYVDRHRELAEVYDLKLDDYFRKPLRGNYESSYWLYTILLPSKQERDLFKQYMLKNGVQVSQVHKRNDEYTVFKPFSEHYVGDAGKYVPNDYPGLDKFADRMICIPVNAKLTDEGQKSIIALANKWVGENKK